jgi:hypothetical protein
LEVHLNGRHVASLHNGERIEIPALAGKNRLQVRRFGITLAALTLYSTVDFQPEVICDIGHSWSGWKLTQRTFHERTSPPQPTSIPPGLSWNVAIYETYRSQEPIGSDAHSIDNRASSVAVQRTLKATREWTQSYTADYESTQTNQIGLTAGPDWLGIRGNVETALRERYSASAEVRRVREEQIAVTVPAHTGLNITLHWKRIVQHGLVRVETTGRWLDIPFHAVAGVTFDQTQEEWRS